MEFLTRSQITAVVILQTMVVVVLALFLAIGSPFEIEEPVVEKTPELIIGEVDVRAQRERAAWEVDPVFATQESPIELPKIYFKLFVADLKGADGIVVEWANPPAGECELIEGLDVMVGTIRYQGWRCAYDWGIHFDWREEG